jgi:nicotinamide mononucleotide transporter
MSSKLGKILTLESVRFTNNFGLVFMIVGVMIQTLTYLITGSSRLSAVSGICGIISVVLCSQRKFMFYVFGFIQLFTYVILCMQQKLYGEIAENAFYFVTMLIGIYHWAKHYDENEVAVETRKLNPAQKMWTAIGTVFGTFILFNILLLTDDTQPFIDAATTGPAFVAQTLMILRYKDSWIYWLIIDAGAIPMWVIAGDWCMVAQFVFWTANCIYGLKKW